jgi:hypothetical protein
MPNLRPIESRPLFVEPPCFFVAMPRLIMPGAIGASAAGAAAGPSREDRAHVGKQFFWVILNMNADLWVAHAAVAAARMQRWDDITAVLLVLVSRKPVNLF